MKLRDVGLKSAGVLGAPVKLEEIAVTPRMIDQEIGGFRFLEKIGEGGMGVGTSASTPALTG